MPYKNSLAGLNPCIPNWLSSVCNDADYVDYLHYSDYINYTFDNTDYTSDYTDFTFWDYSDKTCDFFSLKCVS